MSKTIENTLEIKAKFFALYWGQDVLREFGKRSINEYKVGYLDNDLPDHFLELKPLSSISDEDCFNISYLYDGNVRRSLVKPDRKERIRAGRLTVSHLVDRIWYQSPSIFTDISNVIDYLRNEGYALPWMGLSVEKLIEYGWIKLKED